MRMALCRLVASRNKADNLDAMVRALEGARRRGADVAPVPEVFMAFLHPNEGPRPGEMAEPVDGPFASGAMDVAVAVGGKEARLIVGNADPERIVQMREKLPLLAQRREQMYAPPRAGVCH